jgi:hypothetical protein
MTPLVTVQRVVQLLQEMSEFSEDDVYAAMHAAGIPAADADRAYKFTQIASGRILLAGIVAQFAENYYWLNGAGEVIEAGRLEDEPFFLAATTIVRQNPGPWIGRLGAMSADVGAVNELLKKGSRPRNLQTGPAVLFLEPPTVAGIERANQLVGEGPSTVAAHRKQWWKFW